MHQQQQCTEIVLDAAEQILLQDFWQTQTSADGHSGSHQAGVLIAGRQLRASVHCLPDAMELVHEHMRWRFSKVSELRNDEVAGAATDRINAPMPGRIIAVNHGVGDEVAAGAVVVVMEAMKMEISLRAEAAAIIKAIHAEVDDSVSADTCLVEFEATHE